VVVRRQRHRPRRLPIADNKTGPKGAIYCWHAHKRCGDIQRIWRELGILDHQQIIWVKPTPVFGRVYWHFRHEPCVMGWRQGDKPEHDGVHDHDSVWECDWDGKARIVDSGHPSSKPVPRRPGVVAFHRGRGGGSLLTGQLPPEGLVRDGALAIAEYDCLWEHKRGRDVAALMAAFDAWRGRRGSGGRRRGNGC